ncbi:heterokaryon incompatibility protein-domain-containing protein [Xylaria cubensis]|nr:heterokaryon incompatibility protein-domain-containing protein [Xylaria cubensis]
MDTLEAHHCALCERLVVDVQDQSTSHHSFELILDHEMYGATEDCALFKMLIESIPSAELGSGMVIYARIDCDGTRVTWSIELHLRYTSGGQNRSGRRYFFYVYAQEGDPVNKFIPRRMPNLEPASLASFQTAREWLLECQENHPGCREQVDQMRPTRLLKIPENEAGILHLVNATSEHSYVALSYCWGCDQPYKLTKERLREGVFKIRDLPQTIQDAITVARNLNIVFIWIDALCIVQDDANSIEMELAKMPAIYSNATVTISAANAATCRDGFLKPRDPVDFNKITFKLRFKTPGREEGFIFLAPWKLGKQLESMGKEPINERAWTLQEHIVPPRVLYYSFQQLHWICRKGILPDGGFYPTDRDKPWKGSDIYRIFTLSQASKEMIDPSMSTVLMGSLNSHPNRDIEYDSWQRNWDNLLQDYQARRLTNIDDKLVAVSSVGILFARYMHTEFLAGLFERDLATDLLWNRVDGSEAQARPTKYRAPSWSWASVNSKTENQIASKQLRREGDVTVEVLPWPEAPSTRARIGLIPIELRIRAWITKTKLRNGKLQGALEGATCIFDAIDPELDTPSGTDIVLVEVYWFPQSSRTIGGRNQADRIAGLIALKQEG